MTDLVYRMDGAADPTTVNTTGTAAAAIVSVPAGFACTATSGGAGADMRLAGSVTYKRTGLTALKITTASGVTNIIRLPFAAGNSKVAVEFYHGADTPPGAAIGIAKVQNGSDAGPRINLSPDGSVSLIDAAGAVAGSTAAGAWVTNRRNRIALLIDNSGGTAAGTATLHVYNDGGTTPTGSVVVTGKNLATGSLTNMDIGTPIGSSIAWVEWFEDVQMGDGRTTEFGPYSPSGIAPTVSAGADATVDPNLHDTFTLLATASDADGTIASYLWEDVTSTPATLSGAGASRTVSIPKSVAGSTRTYRVTVTDNSGATATDTVVVTFLPHTRWLKTSGGIAALRRNV